MKRVQNLSSAKNALCILLLVLVAVLGTYALHHHSQVAAIANVDEDTDENIDTPQVYTTAAAAAAASQKATYGVTSTTPQFVLLSFDGSKSIEMLNDTLAFEQKMQSEGKPIHFTYFINASYFLTKDTAQLYQAPGQRRGVSNIGFSTNAKDISLRVKGFNAAFAEGNEIGSHSAGHFSGADWSYDQWNQEFNSFASLMQNVQENNPTEHIDAPTFLTSIHGFRAPNLATNDNLYKVLGEFHFAYDTSSIARPDTWPHKDSYAVWHIPLGTIFVGPNKNAMAAMDYNLWKHQSSDGKAIKGTPLWDKDFTEVEAAYMDYFNTDYNGNRAPVVIGGHFSTWNDGVYWEAMKAFAENVCGKPQVRCVTFKDFVDYLNSVGVPPLK